MKRMIMSFALLGLFGAVASASTLCVNNATYDTYITNYNSSSNACQIGDKLFWGFTFSKGGTDTGGLASDVTVQTAPGDGFNVIGIKFISAAWVADSTDPIDETIGYNVATVSGSKVIKGATLTITGTLTGLGDSVGTTESLTPAVGGSPLVAALPSPASLTIDFSSNMQISLAVSDHIQASVAPGNNSSAHLSVLTNSFTEAVPEPALTLLVGSGLLLFGSLRRRSLKAEELK